MSARKPTATDRGRESRRLDRVIVVLVAITLVLSVVWTVLAVAA